MLAPTSVLVTGANRGIGLEFVKQLVKLPQPPKNVFAACRTPDSAKDLKELAAEIENVTIVRIDMNDLSSVEECKHKVEEISPNGLNLLINNAGAGNKGDKLGESTAQAMTELFTVNAVGPFMVIQAFLPLLRKAAKGELDINNSAIVNMSTGLASISDNSSGGLYAYRTSKAALNMITKNTSIDVRKDNILVNAILPGWVQTHMGGPRARLTTTESVKKMIEVMAAKWRGDSCHGKFYSYDGREMPW